MVIVCSICHDDVNERPQSLPEGQEVIVLALRCGHIYHEVCITEWFKKSAPPYRGPERVTTRVQQGSCPCCKNVTLLREALRIYTTTGEPRGSIEKEKSKLEQEVVEARRQVIAQQKTLNGERRSHKDLKKKVSETTTQLEDMKLQLEENKARIKPMHDEFTAAYQKSDKEKKEALKKLAKQEELNENSMRQADELTKRVERLKRKQAQKELENKFLQAAMFNGASSDISGTSTTTSDK